MLSCHLTLVGANLASFEQLSPEFSLVLNTQFSAGLGEFRIRDLNDEINKLLREKRHWEDRIKELGGPDYWVRMEFSLTF